MKLLEIIQKVEDRTLTGEQLEQYRDQLAELSAKINLELADIKKASAIYFVENRVDTDIKTKRNWQVTPQGQREIQLTYYDRAVRTMLSSLKNRLYDVYRI